MKSLGFAIAVALFAVGVGQAEANTINLNLTGTVGSATPYSFTGGNPLTLYQGGDITLSGITDPFTVTQGDVINASVTLDAPWSIPASVSNTAVFVFLTSPSFTGNTAVSGTTVLSNGSTPVLTIPVGDTTANQLSLGGVVFPPNNGAFSFDSGTFDVTINVLTGTQTIASADLFYQLQSPVPEPMTWAMLLLGFFGVGSMVRGSRRKQIAAIA